MLKKAIALILVTASTASLAQTDAVSERDAEWQTLVTPGKVSYTALGGDTVVLRATVPELPAELASYVADRAEPKMLDATSFPAASEMNASRILVALCGNDGAQNRASFLATNTLPQDFAFDTALGADAYRYKWPACFYINASPVGLTARKDDQISGLFLKMTGWAGDRNAWTAFFARPDVAALKPGEALIAPYLTQPTVFRPNGDPAKFVEEVNALSRSLEARRLSAEALATNTPAVSTTPSAASIVAGGEIILAKSASEGEASYSPPYDCRGVAEAPFDVARVRRAFKRSADGGSDNAISVAVADNGFFGARQINGELSFADKFSPRVFNIRSGPDGAETVGVHVGIDDQIVLDPLNRATMPDAIPDAVSGHGTHVAGLILGGDTAGLASGLFDLGSDDAWIKMTIVPLSDGKRYVSRTALSSFVQLKLQDVDITNFSVKYGPRVEVALRALIEERRDTLFVVAAGNAGRDVIAREEGEEDVFPAAFGGQEYRNVISVAAEDGMGNLTDFTNHSEQFVDIAAPGCNISSWLDGKEPSRLSGTSQASPLVSFAAALLAHRRLTPYQIKRRLLLSGTIIGGRRELADERSVRILPYEAGQEIPIYSMSRLDIPKALMIADDYVRFWEGEGEARRSVELVGKLDAQGLVRCGNHDIAARKILAGKRGPDERFWCFWKRHFRPLEGRRIEGLKLAITVGEAIAPDGSTDPAFAPGQRVEVPAERLQEFIRSNRTMDVIEGES